MDVPTRASTAATYSSPLGGALQKWSQSSNSATPDLCGLCAHVIEYMFDNVHLRDSVTMCALRDLSCNVNLCDTEIAITKFVMASFENETYFKRERM